MSSNYTHIYPICHKTATLLTKHRFIHNKRPSKTCLPDLLCIRKNLSNHTLSHHSIGNLDEASHVGTFHIVDVTVGTCTVLDA